MLVYLFGRKTMLCFELILIFIDVLKILFIVTLY